MKRIITAGLLLCLLLSGCVRQATVDRKPAVPGVTASATAPTLKPATKPTAEPTTAPTQGSVHTGCVEIDGKMHYFSAAGEEVLVVNPWNPLPEDYDPQLKESFGGVLVRADCDEALRQMLKDCQAAGHSVVICSAYRSQAFQEQIFQNRVQAYMASGYNYEEAVAEVATFTAVPGTSEHQTGLAVDIMDADYQVLDDHQADMPAQKWLMAHCWEYGFVLRYPQGTTDFTGIIYEPWHYRYVGLALARELQEAGLCLEAYLKSITKP